MSDENKESETSIMAQSMEEERTHERRWMSLGAFVAVLLFLFLFRACDASDYQNCISIQDKQMRSATACRAAGWP